jgi:hypothetical protein
MKPPSTPRACGGFFFQPFRNPVSAIRNSPVLTTTRFLRAEFSLIHLELWIRAQAITRVFSIRYTATEAIVTHRASSGISH